MTWKKIGCGIMLLFLTGCATAYDVDLWTEHGKTVRNGQDSSENIVTGKSTDIASLGDCPNCSHGEMLLLKVIMAKEISDIETPVFIVKAPRLNTENVEPLTKATVGIAPFVTVERIVDKTTTEIGDESYHSSGGDIDVSKTEVHTTTLGDSNGIDTNYETIDSISNEEVDNESL